MSISSCSGERVVSGEWERGRGQKGEEGEGEKGEVRSWKGDSEVATDFQLVCSIGITFRLSTSFHFLQQDLYAIITSAKVEFSDKV